MVSLVVGAGRVVAVAFSLGHDDCVLAALSRRLLARVEDSGWMRIRVDGMNEEERG